MKKENVLRMLWFIRDNIKSKPVKEYINKVIKELKEND